MAAIKVLIGEAALGLATAAAANGLNGVAETVVLLTGALAGVLWFWANILRPLAKTVRKTAEAVDHLEALPEWRASTDRRLGEVENAMQAVMRDLGIEPRDPG